MLMVAKDFTQTTAHAVAFYGVPNAFRSDETCAKRGLCGKDAERKKRSPNDCPFILYPQKFVRLRKAAGFWEGKRLRHGSMIAHRRTITKIFCANEEMARRESRPTNICDPRPAQW